MTNQPTQAGFLAWVRSAMGISTSALPDNSVFIGYAYDVAIALVNVSIKLQPDPIYMLCVYNLAGSNLINFAQDIPPSTFFIDARTAYGVNSFVAGVVTSSDDQGTGNTLTTPDWFKNLTLADLELLKDPYGRRYLSFAQRAASIWGIS